MLHAGGSLPHHGPSDRGRAGTKRDQTVYDPTCGSGSLLIKAADEAQNGLTVYGQEKHGAPWDGWRA